jgi:hypothetical protein
MYFGDGKENPSMTVRMSIQEEKTTSIEKNFTKLLWLSATTLLAAIGGLVTILLEKGVK